MKSKIDTASLIAQFAAKGGNVTIVPTGVRAIESDRTIYAAMRNGERARADDLVERDRLENLFLEQADAAAEARLNGHRITGVHGNSVTIERANRSEVY